jgi:hypothetical protein
MGGAFVFVERVVGQGTKREQIPIEQRELTLSFERVRIARSIRIVHGSRFHLVACAEIFKGHANCLRVKKLPGSNEGGAKTITLDVNNTLRYGNVQND